MCADQPSVTESNNLSLRCNSLNLKGNSYMLTALEYSSSVSGNLLERLKWIMLLGKGENSLLEGAASKREVFA